MPQHPEPTDQWLPISSAPEDVWITAWLIPENENPWGERPIMVQLSSTMPDKFWHGCYDGSDREKGFGLRSRLALWAPAYGVPEACQQRRAALDVESGAILK